MERVLARQPFRRAPSRAAPRAGSRSDTRTAMMAMTTRSSISVNAARRGRTGHLPSGHGKGTPSAITDSRTRVRRRAGSHALVHLGELGGLVRVAHLVPVVLASLGAEAELLALVHGAVLAVAHRLATAAGLVEAVAHRRAAAAVVGVLVAAAEGEAGESETE